MIIKNMFSKPIDRDIKGVIKVGQDDDANIKQELEEYRVIPACFRYFQGGRSRTELCSWWMLSAGNACAND